MKMFKSIYLSALSALMCGSVNASAQDLYTHEVASSIIKDCATAHEKISSTQHEDRMIWQPSEDTYNISRPVEITNGSLLGFSESSFIGNVIRFLSNDSDGGFSHVGVAVVARPSEVLEMIQKSSESGGLSTRKEKYTTKHLDVMYDYYPYLKDLEIGEHPDDESLDTFCFESTGSAKGIFQGHWPHVQINPLNKVIGEYDGNVCVRSLLEPIQLSDLQEEIINQTGRSYEKKFFQLFKSTIDGNPEEDGSSWFCSELAAHIYKTFGVMTDDDSHANNVIPKEFSTRSEIDFLKGKATDEQWLKLLDSFVEDELVKA